MYLEPKEKASLKGSEIQYPMEGFESSWAKCNSRTKSEIKDSNPRGYDSNLNSKKSARRKGLKFHKDRIQVSILKGLLKKRNSNLQDKGSESLKIRSENFGEKVKRFESLKKNFK